MLPILHIAIWIFKNLEMVLSTCLTSALGIRHKDKDISAIVLRYIFELKLKSGFTAFTAFEHIHLENYTRV